MAGNMAKIQGAVTKAKAAVDETGLDMDKLKAARESRGGLKNKDPRAKIAGSGENQLSKALDKK